VLVQKTFVQDNFGAVREKAGSFNNDSAAINEGFQQTRCRGQKLKMAYRWAKTKKPLNLKGFVLYVVAMQGFTTAA
jgi:hypothetical protein